MNARTFGTDCCQSVFGAGEIDPFFGGSQIMVAYATDVQLPGTQGFARIVVPGDKAGGRFVSNIATIEVHAPPAIISPLRARP